MLAAALGLPPSALAAPVTVVATYRENFSLKGGDLYTITNARSSATGITSIHYDLSGSQASFDPDDFSFTVVAGGEGTGFTGSFDAAAQMLTLSFTDFDPGETFAFRVDTDDNLGFTFGFDFEDTILQVVFDALAPSTGTGSFVSTGLRRLGSAITVVRADVNAVPEPGTAGLLVLGLSGLLWSRRRRAA
jgi:hypothetical protein